MKKMTLSLLLISFAFFMGCKKNKIEEDCFTDIPQEECIPIPPPVGINTGGHQWTKVLPYYEFPYFNPNISDEIIFRLYENSTDSLFQMVKYNLATQQRETIFEGFFAIPKWSRKDWILFAQPDHNIYKIKSSGDSLTQLTFSGNCQGPEWNMAGDKFIYQSIGLNDSVICDEFGNLLDTIDGSSISPSWQHDSLLAAISPAWLYVRNSNSKELDFKVIYEIGTGGTTTAEWLDSDNIVWVSKEGIFKSNIITEETISLQESCDAKIYKYPTVSKISNKVVFQRTDKQLIETEINKGTSTSRMFIMNFDGSEREEIILPQ